MSHPLGSPGADRQSRFLSSTMNDRRPRSDDVRGNRRVWMRLPKGTLCRLATLGRVAGGVSSTGAERIADGAESKATARRGRRRLTWVLVAVAAVLVVVASGAAFLVARDDSSAATAVGEPRFAPYVATTVTPILRFDDPVAAPAGALVLGFVVAAADDSCTPSWGAHYGLDEAAGAPLDLDAQIAALRNQGREAVISFGGAGNTELALRCPDPVQLAAAYAQVVDRYGVSHLDFDLEGAALQDGAATARRAAAVRELQDRAGAGGAGLEVALTLPVGRHGLGDEGVAQLD